MNTSIDIFSTTAITSDSYNYTVVTGCKIYSSITAAVNGGLIVSNYQNIIFANVMILVVLLLNVTVAFAVTEESPLV